MGAVDVSSDNWSEGAGPIDTVNQFAKDLKNPEDWAMDGVALGLDTLGVIADPLGSLASAGIGWLIEHVSFLKEPLDDLAGDPAAVYKVSAVWGDQVRTQIEGVAKDFNSAASTEVASWQGPAAKAYQEFAKDLEEKVKGMEPAADAVAKGVQGAGMLVATVRGIIRDIVADVVGEFIVAAATALASSWFTLGGSIAAFTGWAIARGAATAGKIAGKISKLLNKLSNILNKFSKLSRAAHELSKLAQKFKGLGKTLGKTAGKRGKDFRTTSEAMEKANDNIRNLFHAGGAKNTATRVDDAMSPLDTSKLPYGVNTRGVGLTTGSEVAKEGANLDENYDKAKEDAAKE